MSMHPATKKRVTRYHILVENIDKLVRIARTAGFHAEATARQRQIVIQDIAFLIEAANEEGMSSNEDT